MKNAAVWCRISSFFLEPPRNVEAVDKPVFAVAMVGSVGTFLAHILMYVYWYWIDVPEMITYHYIGLPFLLAMILLSRTGFLTIAFVGIALEFFTHAALATHFLGLYSNLHHPYFSGIVAIAVAPMNNKKTKLGLAVVAAAGYAVLLFRYFGITPIYTPSDRQMKIVAIGLPLYDVSVLFSVLMLLVNRNQTLHKLIVKERERSESLLLNVLPKTIVERLKANRRIIADRFESASVVFLDIADFTIISSSMAPSDVVAMLDEIFSRLDSIAETHGLEKIKTIGDAYMVAAGVPEPCFDHARRAAEMAIDMLDVVKQYRNTHKHEVCCRIGICSGPVVAGVIGRKRFLYDLWGDTVNTASRMESHGIVNQIQVAESTYYQLCHDYQFEYRGEIEVKGKGLMKTWLLAPTRKSTEEVFSR